MYSLQLLGQLSIQGPDGPLSGSVTQRRHLALLALLATADAAGRSRDKLVAYLWPDGNEESARHSLADAVYRLRRSLGDDAIQGDSIVLRLNPEIVRTDVARFEEAVAAKDMESAVALYAGAFLDGFHLRDASEFEHWKDAEARRLDLLFGDALRSLAMVAGRSGDHAKAVESWRRLLAQDPYNSRTVVRLMDALAAAGDPANGLIAADEHAALLKAELGLEPPAELTAAVERLRSGRPGTERPAESRQEGIEPTVGGSEDHEPIRRETRRVGWPSPFDQPDESPVGTTLPTFVGREAELAVLEGWLREASAGRARVGFITGEAGTGKTALAGEFCRRATSSDSALIVASGACNAHTGPGDPHRPFRELLGQLTGNVEAQYAAGSITAEQARRLWSLLPAAAAALAENGPDLIGTFLAEDPLIARARAHPSVPDRLITEFRTLVQRRARGLPLRQADLFEQYVRVLRTLAAGRTLLLVVDDLQWADAGSNALLFEFGRQLSGSRVLVLGLYRNTEVALGRDGGRHPLEAVVHEVTGLLGHASVEFTAAADRSFVDALIDAEPNRLESSFREDLFGQTRGHALFTVELLRTLKDQQHIVPNERGEWVEDGSSIDWTRIPTRVDAVIAERIGRLIPQLQRLLAVASVEGERFTLEAVARVLGMDARELIEPLSAELEKKHHLVVADGLERIGRHRLSIYRFRHILFQRYLYDRLDVVERAHLHQGLGEALEALYAGHEKEIAATLAHHFREAGMPDKAADYFLGAGEQSELSLAIAEALAYYESALQQLLTLPPSQDRNRREMQIQLAIGTARVRLPAEGFAEAWTRALSLAEDLGAVAQRYWASQSLMWVAYFHGRWKDAEDWGRRALSAARESGDDGLHSHALASVGEEAGRRGDRRMAVDCFKEALRLYRPLPDAVFRIDWAELVSWTQSCWALVQWDLGYPESAGALFDEAALASRRAEDVLTLPYVLFRDAICRLWGGNVPAARARCNEAIVQLEKSGGAHAIAPAIFFTSGYCDARSGRVREGLETMQSGLISWKAAGMKLFVAYMSACIARALCDVGRSKEGLHLLADAMAEPAYNEAANAAEVRRHLGEVYLALPQPDEPAAEAAFRAAIQTARQQEARSWDLLATMSLARLLRKQDRVDEAREMLGAIYGWFTEGHDWPYLVEARALLAELEAPA
jgi:DNA-binding SARP family transcriptional activator/tetratricopeptide (TPR) repeat protein